MGEALLRTNTANRAKFHRCLLDGLRKKRYQTSATPQSTMYRSMHSTVMVW